MFKLFSKISIKCHKSFLSIAIPLIKAKWQKVPQIDVTCTHIVDRLTIKNFAHSLACNII